MNQYNADEFTLKGYNKLLDIANERFNFIPFDLIKEKRTENNLILWRHDVDFCPESALKLANIEKSKNIVSTFFFQLTSEFYNCIETRVIDIIKEILSLGHKIGLHFSPASYQVADKETLERCLAFEASILSFYLQTPINVFSFHNPDDKILCYDDFMYAGMVNTYSNYIKCNFDYCSDSNGYWRHKSGLEFLESDGHSCCQFLTHPIWWEVLAEPPRRKIINFLENRKKTDLKCYDDMLSGSGRLNLGISEKNV